jgi:hypothetical protein
MKFSFFFFLGIIFFFPPLSFAENEPSFLYEPMCEEYRNPDSSVFRNKNAIPNIPLSFYLEKTPEEYHSLLAIIIEKDRLCLSLEDLRAELERNISQERRTEILKNIQKGEKSYQDIENTERSEREKFLQQENILSSLQKDFFTSFLEAKENLIKKKDDVIQSLEEILSESFASQKKFSGDAFLQALLAFEKMSSQEQEAFLLQKQNLILEKSQEIEEMIEFFTSVSQDMTQERNTYLQKKEEEIFQEREKNITDTVMKEIIKKELRTLFSHRREFYDDRHNTLIQEALSSIHVLKKSFPEYFSHQSSQKSSQQYSLSASLQEIYLSLDKTPVENIEKSIQNLLQKVNPLISSFLSLLADPEFQLFELLQKESVSSYQLQSLIRRMLEATKAKDYRELQNFFEERSEEFRSEIQFRIDTLKEARDREYTELIRLQKSESFVSFRLQKMIDLLPYTEDIKKRVALLIQEYEGYGDYIIHKVYSFSQETEVCDFLDRAEYAVKAFSELLSKHKEVSKETRHLLLFFLLDSVFESVETTNDFSLSSSFQEKFQKIFGEEQELLRKIQQDTHIFLKEYQKKSSANEFEELFQKGLSQFGISSLEESNDGLFLPKYVQREIIRRAKRVLKGLENTSWNRFLAEVFEEQGRISVTDMIETRTDRYFFHSGKNILIQEKRMGNDKGVVGIFYFNDKNLVEVSLEVKNQGVVSFFSYDEKERVTEILQAQAVSLWDQKTQKFSYPQYWNEKTPEGEYIILAKETYEYFFDYGMEYKNISYSSPLLTSSPSIPHQTRQVLSLYDEIQNKEESVHPVRKQYLENIQEILSEEQQKVLPSRFFTFQNTVSNTKIPLAEYFVYYNEYGAVEFLMNGTHTDGVLNQESSFEFIQERYPSFSFSGEITLHSELDMYDYIGPDGKLLGVNTLSSFSSSLVAVSSFVQNLSSSFIQKLPFEKKSFSFLFENTKTNREVQYIVRFKQVAQDFSLSSDLQNTCVEVFTKDRKENPLLDDFLFVAPQKSFLQEYFQWLLKDESLCSLYGVPLGEKIELSRNFPVRPGDLITKYDMKRTLYPLSRGGRVIQRTVGGGYFDRLISSQEILKLSPEKNLFLSFDYRIGSLFLAKPSSQKKHYVSLEKETTKLVTVPAYAFSYAMSSIDAPRFLRTNTASVQKAYSCMKGDCVIAYLGLPKESLRPLKNPPQDISGNITVFDKGVFLEYGSGFFFHKSSFSFLLDGLFGDFSEVLAESSYPITFPLLQNINGDKGTYQEFLSGHYYFKPLGKEAQFFAGESQLSPLCNPKSFVSIAPKTTALFLGAFEGGKQLLVKQGISYIDMLPSYLQNITSSVVSFLLGDEKSSVSSYLGSMYSHVFDLELSVQDVKTHNIMFQCPAEELYHSAYALSYVSGYMYTYHEEILKTSTSLLSDIKSLPQKTQEFIMFLQEKMGK